MSSITPQPSTSKHADELESPPSSSEEAGDIRKKIIKSYTQKYTAAWEQEPEFKGWLRSGKKVSNYAFCKVCNKDFICDKSEIQKHFS
ncbi:unnamed protein product [Acanthoscelides obtectus]|uniref:BED-type domain-containing protein n=1 Tax=Acanthoscelides obtectus TaxID=200917 RepID=A0A9P0Q3W6_ACAOB|nr:unnamed protein product [Acanthoscelides obtectus]CAK1678379.1 hypothetical protein AOBTE_LOCUS31852 [Acanthoscelides obtectus]